MNKLYVPVLELNTLRLLGHGRARCRIEKPRVYLVLAFH